MGRDRLFGYTEKDIEHFIELAKLDEYEVCVFGAGFLGKEFCRQILTNYGVHIDYYCDNNEGFTGKEIQDGIYCESLDKLVANKEKTICFLMVGGVHTVPIYRQLMALGIRYIVTYNDLLALPATLEQFFPFMRKKQIAVYTCIAGGYDDIHEPIDILDNCDYYIITDKEPKEEMVYKWIDIASVVPKDITNNILKNRYCKMLPHRLFKEYRYSIYIDGNIRLKNDITECIPRLGKSRIGVAGRENVDSIYAHALKAINLGLEEPDHFVKQVEKYWYQGVPNNTGMFWCAILLREHNNPICIKLMEEWWEEYISGVRRDQIAFPYVLWKNGYNADDLLMLCGQQCFEAFNESPYWEFDYGHKQGRKDIWKEEAKKFWTKK